MEENSRNFSIQRSSDGVNWSEVGSVPAAGQSADSRTYSYVDRTAGNSRALYRIVQYDIDGRSTTTGIVRGNCGSRGPAISIYPNPSQGNSTLSISLVQASKVSIRIIDGKGAVVRQSQVQLPSGNSTIPLDMQSYAPGAYTVRVDYDNESQTIKLVRK
jgi:hypothetical protein